MNIAKKAVAVRSVTYHIVYDKSPLSEPNSEGNRVEYEDGLPPLFWSGKKEKDRSDRHKESGKERPNNQEVG